MLATLERLGLSETSGPVVGGVLHAVSGYGEMDSKHAQKLKDVLDKVWLARCKDVYEAQGEMVEAYRKAVNFLRTASKSEQKLVMQLLADALEAASLAYKDKQKREGPVGQVYVELMIRIENRLANLTRTNRRPVEAALDNDKDPVGTRAVKARLAVNNHWKSLLSKDWGVSMRFTPPPPTSKPATTPARAVMASTAPAATD